MNHISIYKHATSGLVIPCAHWS